MKCFINFKTKKFFVMLFIILLIILLVNPDTALACTGIYVGKDVSEDGNAIVARSDDTHPNNKIISLEIVEHINNQPGRALKAKFNNYVYNYPDTTYKYFSTPRDSSTNDGTYGASCTNEYGLLAEATITAYISPEISKIDPLVNNGICEDVIPSIIAATCKTAREGVERISELMQNDGNSECSIVMLADQDEVWLVELYSGHQWAAIKMPTDKVSVFGNEFMIQTEYNINDTDSFACSSDLFNLPTKNNLTVMKDGKMSLCETYSGKDRLADYANLRTYMGHYKLANSTAGEYNTLKRYNLLFDPDKKVGLKDLFDLYRYRYEGTPYSPDETGRNDIRVIGSETQASTHVVQILSDAPKEACDVSWVSLANSEHSIFLPYFSLIDNVSDFYKDTKIWNNNSNSSLNAGDSAEEGLVNQSYGPEIYNKNSAYVCYKRLCSLAEQNRKLYGNGVRDYWKNKEDELIKNFPEILNTTLEKYNSSKEDAKKYINEYTVNLQEDTLAEANTIFDELMWYISGNTDTLQHKFSYKTLSLDNNVSQKVAFSPSMKMLQNHKEELNNSHPNNSSPSNLIIIVVVSVISIFFVIGIIFVIKKKSKKINKQ